MAQRRNRRAGVEDRWQKADGSPSAGAGGGRKRWRARFVDNQGLERARAFDRRVDAQSWLDEQTSGLVTGSYVDPGAGRQTVAVRAKMYVAGRGHLKAKSLESIRSLLDSQIIPRWGETELGRIEPSEVQQWVSGMSAAGLSSSRVRQAFHTFQAILDGAVRDKRLASNPCTRTDLPKLVTSKGHRYLTMAQVLDLADRCGDDGDIVLTLAMTGLRWGELIALQVGSVDFLRKRLAVDASTTDVGGHLVTGTPKTSQRRSVPMPRTLLVPLARRCEGKGAADLLFTTGRGSVLRSRNFRRDVYDPAVLEAKLPAGFTIHELRHTSASLAIGAGASVLAVSRMLGHANPAVTLQIYAGLFDTDLDDVADRLADAAADPLRTRKARKARK